MIHKTTLMPTHHPPVSLCSLVGGPSLDLTDATKLELNLLQLVEGSWSGGAMAAISVVNASSSPS